MASPTPFKLTTALPDLRFESMTHASALSALEETQFFLRSEKPDLAPDQMLGRTLDLAVTLRDGKTRHFCGHVTRFGIGPYEGRWFGYQATVRPWLWFLTRTADCRIFQEQTVREIVEAVFQDHGAIANYEFNLVRSYRKRSYCVQYRETDFNFVARLLEGEGIYWYFEHSEGAHKLVLVDAPDAHPPIEGDAELPHYDNAGQAPPDTEWISNWRFVRAVMPGKTALTSYDFERPSTRLLVEQTLQREHELADYEVFDWQGDYTQKGDGQHLVDDQLDEQQSRFDLHSGSSNAHALATGHTFDLARHARADQNAQYLCTRLDLTAREPGSETSGSAGDLRCEFRAMPAAAQFRPARRTPKPCVQGPQTAVVVGPGGEELFTDPYGRVKVQFHWDRYGQRNERSSCWVRVSSPWAGKSFGFVQVPRIGQEVVVDFLEGDPDQPLITGRVYNAEQMPPWELPANATQSGVLSRSSKGGAYGNANALRFEDKIGAEQVWLHAEKDQLIEVENDETHTVGHDRSKTVDNDETTLVKHDRTETVGNNETITIVANRTENVGANETIGIVGNRTENVGENETITIVANRTETVGANETIGIVSNRTINVGGSETATVALQRTHTVGVNETIAIGAAQEVAIGAQQTIAVGFDQEVTVGYSQSTTVGRKQTNEIGGPQENTIGGEQDNAIDGAQSWTVGKSRTTTIEDDDTLTVGKNLVINATDSVVIRTGDASITMRKNGTVLIKGKGITVDDRGKTNVKAAGNVVVKGSRILQN